MATRSNIPQLPDTDDTDTSLDIPEPFPKSNLDDLPEVETGDDLDALIHQAETDPEELAQRQAQLYLPTGEYVWDMKTLVVKIGNNTNDRNSKDEFAKLGKPHLGRCMVNVYGVVKCTTHDGTGRFNFSFSPDDRHRRDSQGNLLEPLKLDMFSEQYLKLCEVFFQKHERKPKGPGEVIDMVKSGLYKLYITRGKSGNFLNQFREM